MKIAAEIPLENFRAPSRPDESNVRRMFDAFAARYDVFTALIGFGQAPRLRRKALEGLAPGMRVLDLACGTGDLAFEAAERVGPGGEIVGLDLSPRMLRRAAERLSKKAFLAGRVRWTLASAAELPMKGAGFDAVVSAFALRNLGNMETILPGVRDSLSEGGRIAFLDLTEPVHPLLKALYRFYMFVFVGAYGLVLFGRDYPVPYLPDSATRFFKAHEFADALRRAGFRDVTRTSFVLGAVTLYRASK